LINPQFVHTIKPFKVLLILLFFIQSHTIIAQQKWYACIKDQCHENGMNFNEEMDLYENELINSGLLKDKKPKSYLEFYGSVYKNDVFVTFSEERIKKWIELDRNNCTVEIEQSYPSMKEYKRVLDSIVNSSEIYYGDIVSLRSDVFTEKDLREKSIKYFLLYTFVGVQVMTMTDIDAGIARKLPPKTPIVKDKVPYKESQILNVIINGNDEITVDDFVVSID